MVVDPSETACAPMVPLHRAAREIAIALGSIKTIRITLNSHAAPGAREVGLHTAPRQKAFVTLLIAACPFRIFKSCLPSGKACRCELSHEASPP